MDVFSVLTPGGYTTVQDNGRYRYQQMGIPVSGALDSFAFPVANMLVGNPVNCAVLEITVMGPRIEVLSEADIAITGAEMGMTLNDRPVECWRSFRVKSGDVLDIKQVKSGCRAYLAV
ncbi:MAG: KipI antagonist, partial [Deltaproteobacteria bacterium]|nr:KipI antagonist [Deltaproteobacteria bacterium]